MFSNRSVRSASWLVLLSATAASLGGPVRAWNVTTLFTSHHYDPPECSRYCSLNRTASHDQLIDCVRNQLPLECAIIGTINSIIRADNETAKYPICLDASTGSVGFDLEAWEGLIFPETVSLYGIRTTESNSCQYTLTRLESYEGESECLQEITRNSPRPVLPQFQEGDDGMRIGIPLTEYPLVPREHRYQLSWTIAAGETANLRDYGVVVEVPLATQTAPPPAAPTLFSQEPQPHIYIPCSFRADVDDFSDIRVQYVGINERFQGEFQGE